VSPSPIIKAFLILAAVGATLGSALDAIHSHFGALSYPSPLLFQAAAWVPLLFAGAYGAAIARPLLARSEPPPPLWKVALGLARGQADLMSSLLTGPSYRTPCFARSASDTHVACVPLEIRWGSRMRAMGPRAMSPALKS
jgi:hypothetical protein